MGSLGIEGHGPGLVLRHALAQLIAETQPAQRGGIPLIGGQLIKPCRLGVIPGDAVAIPVAVGQDALGPGKVQRGGPPEPRRRLGGVLLHPIPI